VAGRTGSGKSSLLQARLGEMHVLQGNVSVRGQVSYAAQTAWVFNGSVRDNIIFGEVKCLSQRSYDVTSD